MVEHQQKSDKYNPVYLGWSAAMRSPSYIVMLGGLFGAFMLLVDLLPKFLMYKQSVSGIVLWDPITSYLVPIDFNPYIFYITTLAIAVGMLTFALSPKGIVRLLLAVTLLNVCRIVTLYLVNLEPPVDIVPLYDPFLELTFYDNVLITKDLFFSGHTSNIIVFACLTEVKFLKNIFIAVAILVGAMLVLQHVHYTVDVVVAPLFSYGAYRLANSLVSNTSVIKEVSNK